MDNLASFEKNGYLVVRNCIDPNELTKLKEEFLKLVEEVPIEELTTIFTSGDDQVAEKSEDYFMGSSDKLRFFLEDKAYDKEKKMLTRPKNQSINKVGHAMFEINKVFKDFTQLPQHIELAKSLNLKNPLVVQSMYITKQPHVGGEVTPHQDSTFIYTEPESCVAFWWPIDGATIENSCIWVVPGSHKGPLKTRMLLQPNKELIFDPLNSALEWPADEEYIPVEVNAGDVVILHGRIIHKSSENKSERSRHAYTIHLTEQECTWDPQNWLQRNSPFPKLYPQSQ
jgi:phytanoyl-CoA hydroxylase